MFTCSRVDCISEGFPLLFDVVLTILGCDRQPSFEVIGVIFSNLAALQPRDIKPFCSILSLGSSYGRDAKFALHQDESNSRTAHGLCRSHVLPVPVPSDDIVRQCQCLERCCIQDVLLRIPKTQWTFLLYYEDGIYWL